MKQAKLAAFEREALERRLKKWKMAANDAPPKKGWLREIREALGMSAEQLSRMLGVKHQAVTALERAEVRGDARIKSLRKAARELGCDFVYALVPRKPIEEILRSRAFGNLLPEILLTFKKSGIKMKDKEIFEIIHALIGKRKMLDKPRLLWDEPPVLKEYDKMVDRILGRAQASQIGTMPNETEGEETQPADQAMADPIAEQCRLIEDELAHLPPSVRELAKAGKVEG